MLGNLKFRNILIEHYKASREPKWVKRAIQEALYDANISLYAKEATDGGLVVMWLACDCHVTVSHNQQL